MSTWYCRKRSPGANNCRCVSGRVLYYAWCADQGQLSWSDHIVRVRVCTKAKKILGLLYGYSKLIRLVNVPMLSERRHRFSKLYTASVILSKQHLPVKPLQAGKNMYRHYHAPICLHYIPLLCITGVFRRVRRVQAVLLRLYILCSQSLNTTSPPVPSCTFLHIFLLPHGVH